MIRRHISRAAGSLCRHEGGQTLIEFALAAPLLLVFLLALVDFGIAIDRRIVLDHAVREGARYASVGGDAFTSGEASTALDVEGYTSAQAQGIGNAAVCYTPEGGVRVSIDYTYDFVTGFTSLFNLSVPNIPMNASAEARVERPLAGVVEDCVA